MRQRHRVVSILLAVLLLIGGSVAAQEATQEATADVTAEPTAEPTAEATAEPTEEATEEPTQEATEEPEVTAEPTAEVTPEPTEEATEEPEVTESPAPPAATTYTVRPGDNLFRIALRFNVSVTALAQANGITNPGLIFVGQQLTIPTGDSQTTPTPEPTQTPEPTPPDSTTEYVVRPGDSLFRIAARNNTTISQLVQLNNITNPNLIFVGQRLVLPGEEPDDTATPEPQPIEDVPFATGIQVFIEDQNVGAISSQVSQLGVDWVKLVMDWREVEPVQGEQDFSLYDEAIESFSEAGFNILITLTGAPDWSRPSATDYVLNQTSDYGPPDDLSLFGIFAGQVAERYQGQVAAYEIWTEPNLRRTWIAPDSVGATDDEPSTERMSDAAYIDMLRSSYTAIKNNDADALVITGGLAPTGLNDRRNAIDDRVFLRELLRQGAAEISDGIGAQPDGFANPPDLQAPEQADGVESHYNDEHFFFLDTLVEYRSILVDSDVAEVPIWVTRFGWGTADGNDIVAPILPFQAFLTYTDPDEQAEYVTRAFEIGEELGYVGPMILYNLNGCPAGEGEACYYSLIDSSGAARPAFSAVAVLASE